MKKTRFTFLSSLFVLGLATSLISCKSGGGGAETLYKKVKRAFDGVESSFRNMSTRSTRSKLRSINEGSSEALDELNSLFTAYGENLGDSIEELEYDEPPMVQFQCLKSVFNKIGDSFTFGEKYYDTVTGNIYFDLETGLEKEVDDLYKYDYAFTLGLGITVDEQELITADISFDIDLSKDNNHYKVSWFVKMYLEYNMDNSNPNYTLLMLTDNEQTDLPFRLGVTYEYDYVKVIDSRVNEWRKFYYELTSKLAKDSSHPDFASYKDDITYTAKGISWYKNNSLRKIREISSDKEEEVAEGLFKLGLNSTDIKPSSYFSSRGTQSSAIAEMYRDFSNIIGQDIVYDLVTKEEDSHHHKEEATAIKIFKKESYDEFDYKVCTNSEHEITFADLFDPGVNYSTWVEEDTPEIYFVSQNGNKLNKEEDVNKFDFFVEYNSKKEQINPYSYVKSVIPYESLVSGETYELYMVIIYRMGNHLSGDLHFYFAYNDATQDDPEINTIGIQKDETILNNPHMNIVEDISVSDIFTSDKTHKEYIDSTGAVEDINGFKFVYLNKAGKALGEVPLKDLHFAAKGAEDNDSSYRYDDSLLNSKLSEIWFAFNSNYYSNGLAFRVTCKQIEQEELNSCHFILNVYTIIEGDTSLFKAIRNSWPTSPIEKMVSREDFPEIAVSQNIREEMPYKYDFYFDASESWLKLDVRPTEEELNTYKNTLLYSSGYRDNGVDRDGRFEYIKNGCLIRIYHQDDMESDIYTIELYKSNLMVPEHISFDSRTLDYQEQYIIGEDIQVGGIANPKAEEIEIRYFFSDGSYAKGQVISEPGEYEITAEIIFPEGRYNYFNRRLKATFTII